MKVKQTPHLIKCRSEGLLFQSHLQSRGLHISAKQEFNPRYIRKESQNNFRTHMLKTQEPAPSRLQRVKSSQNICENYKEQYENLVEIYMNENKNLKNQNKFLLKEIEKYKKKQEAMSRYIESMRKQTRKMQRQRTSYSPVPSEPLSEYFHDRTYKDLGPVKKSINSFEETIMQNSKHNSNSGTCTSSQNMLEGKERMTNNIQFLEKNFKLLLEQSSKEEDKSTKKIIRARLAETAEKMKKYYKEIGVQMK